MKYILREKKKKRKKNLKVFPLKFRHGDRLSGELGQAINGRRIFFFSFNKRTEGRVKNEA